MFILYVTFSDCFSSFPIALLNLELTVIDFEFVILFVAESAEFFEVLFPALKTEWESFESTGDVSIAEV